MCGYFNNHTHSDVLGTLSSVRRMEYLQAAHVAHVTVQIGTVEAIPALADSCVWAQLLLQLLVGLFLFILILDKRP